MNEMEEVTKKEMSREKTKKLADNTRRAKEKRRKKELEEEIKEENGRKKAEEEKEEARKKAEEEKNIDFPQLERNVPKEPRKEVKKPGTKDKAGGERGKRLTGKETGGKDNLC